MIILLRNSQTARQVVRANQHRVEPLDGADFVQILNRWNAFDIGDQNLFAVPLLQICPQLRLKRMSITKGFCQATTFQWPQLHRSHQSANLVGCLDVRPDHSASAGIERLASLERIIARQPHD
jgi:hypothetical protein